jgi:hypothetical protein
MALARADGAADAAKGFRRIEIADGVYDMVETARHATELPPSKNRSLHR